MQGPSRGELDARRQALRAELEVLGRGSAARLRELVDVDRALERLDAQTRVAQREALVQVQGAMQRLRTCRSPEEFIQAVPRELCQACGFSRAMISEVRGSSWDPTVLEASEEVDPQARDFHEYVSNVRIPLEHMLLEADMVRRRMSALVLDAPGDPRTFKGLVEAARWSSYVAAPIMPTRRVIGFLHADRFGQSRPCDEVDRNVLWSFAEHFGLLFERSVLEKTLESQRHRLQATLQAATVTIDDRCGASVSLVRRGPAPSPARPARLRTLRLDGLLTLREREVLDRLSSGATNALIAQQLVISEGTVKSHLKRIHRKLHVSNRAEAVAKYLRLMQLDEQVRP
jgi:DNA-binding CsgD family transcriptional regulator